MTSKHLMNTYGERALTLTRGEGPWLWDSEGKRYLDALSGIAVCGLGHSHPAISRALTEQANTLVHCSNLYNIPAQEQLADRLCELAAMEQVFFCNSGAEANEAAIKLARLYGHNKGVELPTIIVMEQSFHGRTMATLTATGNRKVQAGFEPLLRGFVRAPFDNVEALENIAANNSSVVAVLVEPIQGEGGVRVPAEDYLRQVRALCDRQGWLMMLDEVQTGAGRTGTFFHYQQHEVLPDVVTIAKGLGNGVPIGACLARGAASGVMKPGNHGSTFGGNPLACAAGLATVNTLVEGRFMARATELGERIRTGLASALEGCAHVKEIRGRGLMIGIELTVPSAPLVPQALEQGLIINATAERVVRLLPPLILTDEQADRIVEILAPLIRDLA